MNRARILIFSASHLCRNPRVVKEATTLGAAGHEVTVLTLSNHPAFETLDRDLLRGRPFRRIALDQCGAAGAWRRGRTWAARKLLRATGAETACSLGPSAALLRRARAFPADLIITHTEIPLWAAGHLIRAGRRVAVDLEDWHSEDLLSADRATRPLTLLRRAENFAMRHAAYVSTTSASMASALVAAYGGHDPIVIRNTFPIQPDPRPARRPDAEPRLVWFSQTIGPGRGLEEFITGWSHSRLPGRVTLIGSSTPDYRDKLLRLAPATRRDRINFNSPVPPDTLPTKLAEFDIGLALEPCTPRNRDLTISNKILQYLNAGLAVLATDTAGQCEVLRIAPDCGLSVGTGSPARIVAALDELLSLPGRLAACQQAARTAAERTFCWEVDAPRLLAAVEHALGTAPPPRP